MVTNEQVKRMIAVRNYVIDNGVCCKNCKHWFYVQKDLINIEWGGCSMRTCDNKTFEYALPVSEDNYCRYFFWKE